MTNTDVTSESREQILSSIREHLAASKRFDGQAVHPQTTQPRTKSNSEKGTRNETVIELFRQALEAVSGHCSIVRTIDEAARAVQEIVDARRAQRVAVSDSNLVKRILGRLKTEAAFLDAPNQ